MASGPHIVFIPGEADIDIVESLKLALIQLRQRGLELRPARQYIGRGREKIQNLAPNMHQRLARPMRPLRRYGTRVRRRIIESKEDKAKRIKRELIDAGITFYGLMKSEARFLPKILHPDEHVKAIVYGQHRSSSAMLIATNERIVFLDKKPMALFLDEVTYDVVSGIEFEIHTLFATLILHTPVKNYDIRFANLRCAENFAKHIEKMRLLKSSGEEANGEKLYIESEAEVAPRQLEEDPIEDLAGYYWLPTEEEERRRITGE